MNKSLVILVALTVAAATWYVGQRWYGDNAGPSAPAAEQTQVNPAVIAAGLDASKTKEQTDASKLQTLLKGQNAAALLAAQLAVQNANANLNAALEDEYSQAYDAIYNKTDVLFKTTKTSSSIVVPVGAGIQAAINVKRQAIGSLLNSWTSSNGPLVAAYLAELQSIVATLTPENSGLTQAQITAYQNVVVVAVDQVNKAIANVATAQADATLANDQLVLQQAAGDPNAIKQAEDIVNQDQQNIAALEAELAAEAAAAAGNGSTTATTPPDTTDGTGDGNNPGNAGNNPGNYTYGSGSIQEQQQQFQEIIKNGPPELLNF